MLKCLSKSNCILILVLALLPIVSIAQTKNVLIEGELKKWHKITLSFEGDFISENDSYNPFLNYRLNVTFKHNEKIYVVPGFYAADGNAAETSAEAGNVWKVRFVPDAIGEWTYEVSFRKGDNIAVNDNEKEGESISFDGVTGIFTVGKSDKNAPDFRSKGKLKYVNERYLRFSEKQEAFLKGGADSPENFLGYYEFDQTPATHNYETHTKDWKQGNPTWQNGKGKGIIGALNYLSSKGMNSVYFLTMNIQGDGKDVWPWIAENERYRFDCSKLDQWEIVFNHMDSLGLMLHMVTQETENELLLDIGELGVQRKLYYRELIARFSHHLAVTWNLGEENGPLYWTPKGQTDEDRKAMAKYIKSHDPYKNFIVIHTHSLPEEQDLILNPLLGYEYLDGPSIQIKNPNSVHEITKKWILNSKKENKNWVVCNDEIGPAVKGVQKDIDNPNHDDIRGAVLWGNLMAGGAGVEWYFGHEDLTCDDWRTRDEVWNQTKYALDFFQTHLPFTEMEPYDSLTANKDDYIFAKKGAVYTIYLPKVEVTEIDLTNEEGVYTVHWYNPREGGKLLKGTLKSVKAGNVTTIGFPPNKNKDWVVLLRRK